MEGPDGTRVVDLKWDPFPVPKEPPPIAPPIKLGLDGLWGMYIHSNLDVRPSWLSCVLNGPERHRWHHATEVIDIGHFLPLAYEDWPTWHPSRHAAAPQREPP